MRNGPRTIDDEGAGSADRGGRWRLDLLAAGALFLPQTLPLQIGPLAGGGSGAAAYLRLFPVLPGAVLARVSGRLVGGRGDASALWMAVWTAAILLLLRTLLVSARSGGAAPVTVVACAAALVSGLHAWFLAAGMHTP